VILCAYATIFLQRMEQNFLFLGPGGGGDMGRDHVRNNKIYERFPLVFISEPPLWGHARIRCMKSSGLVKWINSKIMLTCHDHSSAKACWAHDLQKTFRKRLACITSESSTTLTSLIGFAWCTGLGLGYASNAFLATFHHNTTSSKTVSVDNSRPYRGCVQKLSVNPVDVNERDWMAISHYASFSPFLRFFLGGGGSKKKNKLNW